MSEINKKSIAIMQPYFFPYLGYFQLIDKSDFFLFYGHVDFSKRSYVTRNYLVAVNNLIEPIKIKTHKAPFRSKIKDIKIIDSTCQKYLLKKIKNIYARSPHFEEVFCSLEPLINYETGSLMDYNTNTLEGTCQLLGIHTEFLPGRTLENDFVKIEDELLETEHSSDIKRSSRRVLKLCSYFGANTYINPEGGVDIYDAATFKKSGISLKFHKSDVSSHRKSYDSNAQYSSIIDVLMFNGIKKTKKMLKMGYLFEQNPLR